MYYMTRVEMRLMHLIGLGLNYIHYNIIIADSRASNMLK